MSANFTPDQKGYKTYKSFGTFRLFVLENFPFIAEDFDALTYYQMLCKIVGYLQDVITNNESLQYNQTELLDAFNELQSYVNNYFTDLNIQTEINNKLDQMAQNGTLANIINQQIFNELNEKVNSNTSTINTLNNKLINIKNSSIFNKMYQLIKPDGFNSSFYDNLKIYYNKNSFNYYIDIDSLLIAENKIWYISPTGNDANDGLSESTPKKSVSKLLELSDFSWHDIIIMLDGLYAYSDTSFIITKPCKIMPKNPGKVACFMGTRYDWTKEPNYNNVYYTNSTNVVNCFDMTNYETPIPLKKVTSLEEVNSTEGSYYTTSGQVYVNLNYYTIPSADNCAVCRSYGNSFGRTQNMTSNTNWKLYLKDLIFVGCQNYAFRVDYQGDNISPMIIVENCKFLCGQYVNTGLETVAGVAGGIRIAHARGLLKNCIASLNDGDGFAYTSNAVIIELDNIGSFNGRSNAENYNGSTAHNNCRVIRINGTYFNNRGPNVADVLDDCRTLNINCISFDSIANTPNAKNDFMVNKGAKMYLLNCYSKYSLSTYNIYNEDHETYPDSNIYLLNCEYDTIDGYITNYIPKYIGNYNYDTL